MQIRIVFLDGGKDLSVPLIDADELSKLKKGEEFSFPRDLQINISDRCRGRFVVVDWLYDNSSLETKGKRILVKKIGEE